MAVAVAQFDERMEGGWHGVVGKSSGHAEAENPTVMVRFAVESFGRWSE